MRHFKHSLKRMRRVGYGYLQPRKRKKTFIILVLLAVALVGLFWGIWRDAAVQAWASQQVKTQLAARGLKVEFSKLEFDPLGRLAAKNLEVFQTRGDQVSSIHVDRVLFSLNWFSWWRGQPFITHARIRDASIRLPITSQTAFELQKLDADIELRTGALVIRSVKAQLGALTLSGMGTLWLDGQASQPLSTATLDNAAIARNWENIEREIHQLSSPVFVHLEFEAALRDLLGAQARLTVSSNNLWVRGLLLSEVDIHADYQDRTLRLGQLHLQLGRGGVNGEGSFNLRNQTGAFNYSADLDLRATAALLPESTRQALEALHGTSLPHIEGLWEGSWNSKLSFFTQATLEWQAFSIASHPFEHLKAQVAWDGARLLLADGSLKDAQGEIRTNLLLDQNRSIHGKLVSTLDFTVLRPLCGAAAQPFLSSLDFSRKPPQIECSIEGSLPSAAQAQVPGANLIDLLKFEGKMEAHDFSYTNGKGTRTQLDELRSPFRFEKNTLYLPELYVQRVPGEECWAQVDYHFKERFVALRDTHGYVDIQKAAPVFGPKLEEYVKPYRLHEPARFKAEGIVDLNTQEKTDLTMDVESKGSMDYTFLKKDVPIKHVNAHLVFKGKKARAEFKAPTLAFDGQVKGVIELELEGAQPPFEAQMSWSGASLQEVLTTYFNKQDATGSARGHITLSGKLNDLKSLRGEGEIFVEDGDIYDIPVLGGTSKASEAKSSFSFNDGILQIEQVEIASAGFAVIGGGTYDLVLDNVNLSLRVNMRGPLGIALFPISKLFEYEGRGPLDKVEWNSKSF